MNSIQSKSFFPKLPATTGSDDGDIDADEADEVDELDCIRYKQPVWLTIDSVRRSPCEM